MVDDPFLADAAEEPSSDGLVIVTSQSSEEVALCIRHHVNPRFAVDFERWAREAHAACAKVCGDTVVTTLVRPRTPGEAWLTVARFPDMATRDKWRASLVRKEVVAARAPFLASPSKVEFEVSGIGDDVWSPMAQPLLKPGVNAPQSSRDRPPCKYRLLLLVWACAVATSILLSYTVVPLFKDKLMKSVGHEAFVPVFSATIISMVMPIVFMLLVPICATWICPDFVRARPSRTTFPKGACGAFLYWFLVG